MDGTQLKMRLPKSGKAQQTTGIGICVAASNEKSSPTRRRIQYSVRIFPVLG
jgi:hypothetical protein